MKNVLTILGAIFAIILLILGVLAAIYLPQAFRLDKEAVTYIETNVPMIVENWDPTQLMIRATPELSKSASEEDLKKIFSMWKRLGKLKSHYPPVGRVGTQSFTGSGTKTLGDYTLKARFEAGEAVIAIQLLRVDNGWKINGFHINSNAFMN
jgi:hypothetical protein